ncbi:Hepatocellular carcinoma-associated antigen 59 family protein [Aphelenchoides avenae]|nr:Hepatocellular carcinoma-associated antigen 59 family protein [Aphelenchus avenae]
MRSLGYTPTVSEARQYIERNGHSIDFAKFLELLHEEQNRGDPSMEVIRALRGIDENNRGYMTRQEFTNLLCSFGEKLSPQEVDHILRGMRITSDQVPLAKVVRYAAGKSF